MYSFVQINPSLLRTSCAWGSGLTRSGALSHKGPGRGPELLKSFFRADGDNTPLA